MAHTLASSGHTSPYSVYMCYTRVCSFGEIFGMASSANQLPAEAFADFVSTRCVQRQHTPVLNSRVYSDHSSYNTQHLYLLACDYKIQAD